MKKEGTKLNTWDGGDVKHGRRELQAKMMVSIVLPSLQHVGHVVNVIIHVVDVINHTYAVWI